MASTVARMPGGYWLVRTKVRNEHVPCPHSKLVHLSNPAKSIAVPIALEPKIGQTLAGAARGDEDGSARDFAVILVANFSGKLPLEDSGNQHLGIPPPAASVVNWPPILGGIGADVSDWRTDNISRSSRMRAFQWAAREAASRSS